MKKFMKISKNIYSFFNEMAKDRVGIYTAQASFFITLSLFPFLLLFLNIIGLTNIDKSMLINVISNYAPKVIEPLLVQIINELYLHVSGTIISITAIAAIWSASKGILSVMFGLYEISKIHRERNYFFSRFISMFYTALFLIAIIVTMVLLVFGNKIFNVLLSFLPILADITILTIILRYLGSFIILSAFFLIIYKIANFKLITVKKCLPGAFFSALGWMIFSYVFSIYIDNFSNMSYMYGSLTAFIIIMLWIYFCIYILFIGAEINKYLRPETESYYYEKVENSK